MIPKKIHYCWFGGNPLPEDAKRYIESWKKYCSGYEMIEWNENNFDVNSNIFTKEAFENKKWAFITDYVRLYVLYNYGGVYLDTDVEIIKPLDAFLNLDGFSGFEGVDRVPTGIMASSKGNLFIKELLNYYTNKHFVLEDGKLDLTTNVEIITRYAKKHGLVLNNTEQTIENYTFFPCEYFCPKDSRTLNINITNNTYTIHHFAGSWMPSEGRFKKRLKKILGPKICAGIVNIIDRVKK